MNMEKKSQGILVTEDNNIKACVRNRIASSKNTTAESHLKINGRAKNLDTDSD